MNLSNLKIQTRLGVAFALMLILMCLTAAVGAFGLQFLNSKVQGLVVEDWAKVKLVMPALDNLRGSIGRVFQLVAVTDAAQVKTAHERLSVNLGEVKTAFDKLDPLLTDPEARKLMAKVKERHAQYLALVSQTFDAVEQGKREEAQKLAFGETYAALHATAKAVRELTKYMDDRVDEAGSKSTYIYSTAVLAVIIVGLLGIAVGLLTSVVVTRSITRPLAKAVALADAIAIGVLDGKVEVTGRDESAHLLASMKKMEAAIVALADDTNSLCNAAVEGQLSARADASKHPGEFGNIMRGVNDTLDAVIAPLNVAAGYVARIAQGDIPAKIDDRYAGDFNTLKNNLNTCIDAVNGLVADVNMLSKAAVDGDLSARADAAKHRGEFRNAIEGVNSMLNAIVAPVQEVVRVLQALSTGDLTQQINSRYNGTFEQLRVDINTTVEKLTGMISNIKESTASINVAAKEIVSGNTDLSSRTEEQASSLEETASSMEELTSTVKQNAENARQANQLAAGASDIAVKGGEVVGQVVSTMSSINESSKQIVDIIAVIDGIAFQTNILALNAAVEAARAGEQGRGFAVVATEVRTLAQRSAAAAKEIKDLIGDSVEKVGAGTKLVDEAGTTMGEIVSAVKRVTDIMAEIAAASYEQSGGIEQVNTAITQMDQVTQQNAALVEQAAAAAESLEEQAMRLAQAVATFRLQESDVREERRGAHRASNVARLPSTPSKPKPIAGRKKEATSGGASLSRQTDEWEEF